ncbi:MAG: CheR family methyltransferase, partial [Ruminiclostridium sp.]
MISITEKEFRQLAEYIKEHYGINLKAEKQALVTGRLNNILVQKNIKSFSEYYNYIVSDKTGNAAITLIDKITT